MNIYHNGPITVRHEIAVWVPIVVAVIIFLYRVSGGSYHKHHSQEKAGVISRISDNLRQFYSDLSRVEMIRRDDVIEVHDGEKSFGQMQSDDMIIVWTLTVSVYTAHGRKNGGKNGSFAVEGQNTFLLM